MILVKLILKKIKLYALSHFEFNENNVLNYFLIIFIYKYPLIEFLLLYYYYYLFIKKKKVKIPKAKRDLIWVC